MATGLNTLIGQGKPIVEFNIYSSRVNAPYVGERSVDDWAILGKDGAARRWAAQAPRARSSSAPALRASRRSSTGSTASRRGLGAGLTIKGPFDVTGDPTKNYTAWQQLIAANPDAKALIGVCAQDLENLGKLNKLNGSKFITGGGDPTLGNLAALESGNGLVSIGQTGYVQGYLPIKMIVDALRSGKALPKSGFISSGYEVITKAGAKEDHGLPHALDGPDQGLPDQRSRAEEVLPPALLREAASS